MNDFGEGDLQNVGGPVVAESRDQDVDVRLGHDGLHGDAPPPDSSEIVGERIAGSTERTESSCSAETLSFTSTFPRSKRVPCNRVKICSMAWRLAGSAAEAGLAMTRCARPAASR